MFNGNLALLTGAPFFRFPISSDSHSRSIHIAGNLTLVPQSATKATQPRARMPYPPVPSHANAVVKMEPPTTCKQRPPPRPNLSASLLFGAKELRQYLRFHQETTLRLSPRELDRIPTVSEYADYLVWKKEQCARDSLDDSGSSPFDDLSAHLSPMQKPHSESDDTAPSFAVATKCGHTLHPGTPYPHSSATTQLEVERCPPCTITMHIQYMALLTEALNASGGAVRPRENPGSKHEAVFQAWNYGKLHLVQTVYQFEEYAKCEDDFKSCIYRNLSAWETKSAEEALERVRGAKEALEAYYSEELGIQRSEGAPQMQRRTEKQGWKMQQWGKRKVEFRDDTSFEPSRCHAYFCRGFPRYDGKYLRQHIYEEEDSESDSDTEISTIHAHDVYDEDTESDYSDEMEGNRLERYSNSNELRCHKENAYGGVELDSIDLTSNVSFESSSSNSDITIRESSTESDSEEESDTDIDEMEVEDGGESISLQCDSDEDDSGDEGENDGSDEENSDSEATWDEDDDEDMDGCDFIVFG